MVLYLIQKFLYIKLMYIDGKGIKLHIQVCWEKRYWKCIDWP